MANTLGYQRQDNLCTSEPYQYSYPPTANDWLRIKPLLIKLYRDGKRTLAAIIAEVQRAHGFRASSRMFKRKFAAWGIERKLKQDEVKFMLALEHFRRSQGKSTNFYLRGKHITPEDLRRYVRRKKLKVSDVIEDFSNGHVRPCGGLQAFTPRSESPVLLLPATHKAAESICHEWKSLIHSTFESGMCLPGDSGLVWIYRDRDIDGNVLETFEVFQDFAHYSRAGLGRREMLLLRRGCLLLENVMECCSFLWWIAIIQVVASLFYTGQQGLARIVLNHISGLLQLKKMVTLPHRAFLNQVVSTSLEDFIPLTVRFFDILIDAEFRLRQHDRHFTWNSRVDLWRFRRRHGHSAVDTEAFRLLQEGLAQYGPHYPNKMIEALTDDAYWCGIDLKDWYAVECDKAGLSILERDQPFNLDTVPLDGQCLDRRKYMGLGCQCFNNGNLEAARWYWIRAVENPTHDDLAIMSASFHYILEYLDYLSTESAIADGNLRWRIWKADIEAVWQSALEVGISQNVSED